MAVRRVQVTSWPARWPGPTPSLDDGPLRVMPGPHAAILGTAAVAAAAANRGTRSRISSSVSARRASAFRSATRSLSFSVIGFSIPVFVLGLLLAFYFLTPFLDLAPR